MSLWQWIKEFPIPSVATPATPATTAGGKGELSQLSQLSQGVKDSKGGANDDVRETLEERAAIMEFDGGLSRREAECAAGLADLPDTRNPPSAPLLAAPIRWRGEGLDLGDLRPCQWCRNFTRTGRCLTAWRGELRAARDWVPTFPGMPQRCVGYKPSSDDPDQRPGRERWPDMVSWQACGYGAEAKGVANG